MESLTWNAPMPPPEILRGYNDVIPDGAERLFRQFEIEADARREHMRRGQTPQSHRRPYRRAPPRFSSR
jgi:uncharacterized membrane protein